MSIPHDELALEIFGEMAVAESDWKTIFESRCGSDESLRQTVESLWHDYQTAAASNLLGQSAIDLMAAQSSEDAARSDEWLDSGEGNFGRFRLLRRLGHGGQGEVWLAVDPTLNREVALKIVPPSLLHADVVIEKLRIEAEITGSLEHPNIIPIYEAGRDSRQFPFYAMRVLRDETLQVAIDGFHRNGRADNELRSLLRRFIDVCQAVAYAHSRGVIHRDLKPQNVMLGEFGETLVVDWGIAKVIGQVERATDHTTLDVIPIERNQSLEGEIKGTPAYMSPEQARGQVEALGPPTDIFALGGILFSILTGQAPLTARTYGETTTDDGNESLPLMPNKVLERARMARIPRPSSVSLRIPRALEAVCQKSMSPLPEDRYRSAVELAKDVERWLNEEPVSAWSEPWAVRVRRWLRTHQTRAASIAVTFVIALGATAGMMIFKNQQLVTSNRQLDRRNDELDKARTQLQAASNTLEATNQNLQERNEELQTEQARRQLVLEVGFRLLRGIESHRTWSIDDAYSDILQNGLQLPDNERAAMLPLFQALIDIQRADSLNQDAERISETDAIGRMKQFTMKAEAASKLGLALVNLETAIQLHEQSGLAWLLKAQIRRECLQQPAAVVLPDWNRVTELLPTSSAAFSGRGWCYLVLKNPDEALRDFHRAIEFDPGNEYAHAGLGELAELRHDFDTAVHHRCIAAELPPRFNTDKVWQLAAKVQASHALWARAMDRNAKGKLELAFDDTILAVQFGQPRECKLLWENSLELVQKLSRESVSAVLPKVRSIMSRFRDRPEFQFNRDILVAVMELQAGSGKPQAWKELRARLRAQPRLADECSEKMRSELRRWLQTVQATEEIHSEVSELLHEMTP